MQSDGGLTPENRFSGHKAILSGPAGGVVGYARTTFGRKQNILKLALTWGAPQPMSAAMQDLMNKYWRLKPQV
jgi:hypothetical protein